MGQWKDERNGSMAGNKARHAGEGAQAKGKTVWEKEDTGNGYKQ